MSSIRWALLGLVTLFASASAASTVQSRGPILLHYTDSVMPSGVCKLMACEFMSSSTSGSTKTYVYSGMYGHLNVSRDATMRITSGTYVSTYPLGSGAKAELIKFARGFSGISLTDQQTTSCLDGVTLRGQADNALPFEFTCTRNGGQVSVKVGVAGAARTSTPAIPTAASPARAVARGVVGWPGTFQGTSFCQTYGCKVTSVKPDEVSGTLIIYRLTGYPRAELRVSMTSEAEVAEANLNFWGLYVTQLGAKDYQVMADMVKVAVGQSVVVTARQCEKRSTPQQVDDGAGHNYTIGCGTVHKDDLSAEMAADLGIKRVTNTVIGVSPQY